LFVHDIAIGIASLAAVLGLIWLAARLARSGGLTRHTQAGRITLVQSVALDARRRVVLIAVDGRDILLLTGGPTDLVLSAAPGDGA
jgi:flagellar protein FliO/FliZ